MSALKPAMSAAMIAANLRATFTFSGPSAITGRPWTRGQR
jgi:hypothetical protein